MLKLRNIIGKKETFPQAPDLPVIPEDQRPQEGQ